MRAGGEFLPLDPVAEVGEGFVQRALRFQHRQQARLLEADAYRAAYNTEKMADNSIHVNASKLIADAKVTLRVGQLRSEIAKRNLWTREMSVKALVKAYRVAEDGGNPSAMTGAVRELNAMHGFNEPSKLDVTSSDGSMTPKVTAIRIIGGDDNA